jgi:hypothetical protein
MLAVAMDGQAKQLGSTADFIRMIHEIALERFASSMGRRGGRKRAASAQRDAKGRMLPARKVNQSDCPLCDDPSVADFSIAQFEAHQGHKGRGRPQRFTRESREESEETPFETVLTPSEGATGPKPQYPLPYVEREVGGSGSGASTSEGNGTGESASHDEANLH